MTALHFEGLLSQQRCTDRFTTARRKQRVGTPVGTPSGVPRYYQSTAAVACFHPQGSKKLNTMRCKCRFISNIIQHRRLHRQSGVIIYFPRVYFGVGKIVFIGRLAETVDLRQPSTSDLFLYFKDSPLRLSTPLSTISFSRGSSQ